MSRRRKKLKEVRPIRILSRDVAEYNRLKKNTKSKIKRVEKEYGIDVSNAVNIPSINDFKTRKQFNEWKKDQQWFTNKSNLNYQYKKNGHGIVRTKSSLNKTNMDNKKSQRNADELIAKIEPLPWYSRGKQYGTVKERRAQLARPTTAGIIRPLDFNFEEMKTEKQMLEKEVNMARKASGEYYKDRMDILKENFMELMRKTFNSDADELITMINNVPSDDFYEMYEMYDEFNFEVYYVPKDVVTTAMDGNIEQMISYIEAYYLGDVNLDMKGLFKS